MKNHHLHWSNLLCFLASVNVLRHSSVSGNSVWEMLLGQDNSNMGLNLYFLEFHALCNLLLLSTGRTWDFLLTNREQQRWWDVTSMIRLHKIVTSVFLADTPLLALIKRAAMLKRRKWQCMGRVALVQANKELSLVENHVSLEAEPSAVETSYWTPALADILMMLSVRDLDSGEPGKLC